MDAELLGRSRFNERQFSNALAAYRHAHPYVGGYAMDVDLMEVVEDDPIVVYEVKTIKSRLMAAICLGEETSMVWDDLFEIIDNHRLDWQLRVLKRLVPQATKLAALAIINQPATHVSIWRIEHSFTQQRTLAKDSLRLLSKNFEGWTCPTSQAELRAAKPREIFIPMNAWDKDVQCMRAHYKDCGNIWGRHASICPA